MTNADVTERLRGLLTKCTPLPWSIQTVDEGGCFIKARHSNGAWISPALDHPSNAEMIVAALNSLPQIMDELSGLRALVSSAELREVLKECREHIGPIRSYRVNFTDHTMAPEKSISQRLEDLIMAMFNEVHEHDFQTGKYTWRAKDDFPASPGGDGVGR